MRRSISSLSLILAGGLVFGSGLTAPVFAADAMAGPAMDCSKADMMMMPAKPDAMADMKPSGNVDKDFMQMMVSQHQAMVAMAKVEVSCGKDAKTKAMAQKHLDQAAADSQILQDLLQNDAKI